MSHWHFTEQIFKKYYVQHLYSSTFEKFREKSMILFLKTGHHYVALAGPELLGLDNPSASAF
jgi:hypothetical protein